MTEACDICRTTGSMKHLIEVSLSGVLDAVIAECASCGFRQVRPRLQRSELGILYPDEYFDSESSLGFSDYWRQQQRAEREAYFLAAELRNLASGGRLLEVGCALGFLLDGVRRYCDWEVTGVDVSELGIYFARRRYELDAHCATLEEMAFEDGSFDYLVQKDLLEHVPDPRAHLMEAARILKSGGRTWVITPNGDGNILPLQRIAARIAARGEDRLPLIDQGHLSFFRLEHLRTLFDECGFEIVKARSIDIKRGMRALGMLPMKSKSYQTGPKGNVRGACNDEQLEGFAGSGSAGGHSGAIGGSGHHISGREAAMDRVYVQIVEEMESNAKPLRSTPAYFQFRRLSGLFDSVPASNRWGNDFEFILQRR